MKFRTTLCTFGLFVCVSQALAQLSHQPMTFTFHDPCGGGNADSCATVMVGQGRFDASTASSFIEALKKFSNENKITKLGDGISTVIMSSPGGSLAAGIEMGNEIRRLRMSTTATSIFDEYARLPSGNDYIKNSILKRAECLSACAYAFLGGVKRSVETEKTLGIHQFRSYIAEGNLESNTQALTARLALYVERMGASPQFMTLASMTPPDEITYLGTAISRKLMVDNVNIAQADWQVKAAAGGVPILAINQPLSQFHDVQIVVFLEGQQVLVAL